MTSRLKLLQPWLSYHDRDRTGPLNCKEKKTLTFLVRFYKLGTNWDTPEKRAPYLRNCLHNVGLWPHLWRIFYKTTSTITATTKTQNIYSCFVCMYVFAPCVWLVPRKAKRRHQTPWYWSYRWLQDVPWVLGNEPRSSGRVAITPNHWNLSLALGGAFS